MFLVGSFENVQILIREFLKAHTSIEIKHIAKCPVTQGGMISENVFVTILYEEKAETILAPTSVLAIALSNASLADAFKRLPISLLTEHLKHPTVNCLNDAHITTLGQLLETGKSGLLHLRNFGEARAKEVNEQLVFNFVIELPE